eukprot:gene38866-26740_t
MAGRLRIAAAPEAQALWVRVGGAVVRHQRAFRRRTLAGAPAGPADGDGVCVDVADLLSDAGGAGARGWWRPRGVALHTGAAPGVLCAVYYRVDACVRRGGAAPDATDFSVALWLSAVMDGCGDDIAYVPAWWMRVFSRLYLEVVAGVEILSDTCMHFERVDLYSLNCCIELFHSAPLMHMTTRVLGYTLVAIVGSVAMSCFSYVPMATAACWGDYAGLALICVVGLRDTSAQGGDSNDGLFGGSPLACTRSVPVWVKNAFGIVVLASTTCAVPFSATFTVSVILCMVGIANWVMHIVSGDK